MSRIAAAVARVKERIVQSDRYAVSIVVTRDDGTTASMTATVSQELLKVSEASGATRTLLTERSYTVAASDYDFGAGAVEPRRGDRIAESIGGATRYFDVLSPGGNEPAWHYTEDGTRQLLRIHTKKGLAP